MAKDDVADSQVEEENLTGDDEEEDPKEVLKKVIEVDVADAGVLRKTLTITVPRDALQEELDKDYKELISEAVVPGFRRGRARRHRADRIQWRSRPDVYGRWAGDRARAHRQDF